MHLPADSLDERAQRSFDPARGPGVPGRRLEEGGGIRTPPDVGGTRHHRRMNFRTADGASYEGKDEDGHDVFKVSIPLDEHGYLGRQCPSCEQIFRVKQEDYDAAPDDLLLWCTYCGHRAPHGEFVTQQQKDRMMQVARDAGLQLVDNTIGKAFRDMARRSAGNKFVRVEYRSKPFYPKPLPGIHEEALIRERSCPTCQVRYAVFGDHRFCPFSGPLTAADVAADALAAETAKLDALGSIPAEAAPALREQGVFDRIYVDTLGGVVGMVETLAKDVFTAQVPDAAQLLASKGNVFQRLDDLADLFTTHLGVDLRNTDGLRWDELKRLWAARHVHTHNGGVVDDRYLRAVPLSPLQAGQRVIVTEADGRQAIAQARRLCHAIAEAPGSTT